MKLTVLLVICLLAVTASGQWLETTIYLPDSLSGLANPGSLTWNTANNTVYVGGYSPCVFAIDGHTDKKIARIPAGSNVAALCYNPNGNKVYCANIDSNSVTAIDGETNRVIATVPVGDEPRALCYDPQERKIYCMNTGGSTVTIIDCATNRVLRTIGVGPSPSGLCCNPAEKRVYAASPSRSSISVIRDSMPGGVAGHRVHRVGLGSGPSIVRGVLVLAEAVGGWRSAAGGCLLDMSGRKVMDLEPGANDIRHVAPGAYFIRQNETDRTTKVVVQK